MAVNASAEALPLRLDDLPPRFFRHADKDVEGIDVWIEARMRLFSLGDFAIGLMRRGDGRGRRIGAVGNGR